MVRGKKQMLKPVKLISLGNAKYCLVSPTDEWKEGKAFDTAKQEIIYYNGDYGETRPSHIMKVVAEHNEIGWVRHLMKNSPFVSKFEDVLFHVNTVLEFNNGNCFVECEPFCRLLQSESINLCSAEKSPSDECFRPKRIENKIIIKLPL